LSLLILLLPVLLLLLLLLQFLRWDTVARRRIDLVGRTDDGDTIVPHEFNHTLPHQVLLPAMLLLHVTVQLILTIADSLPYVCHVNCKLLFTCTPSVSLLPLLRRWHLHTVS